MMLTILLLGRVVRGDPGIQYPEMEQGGHASIP